MVIIVDLMIFALGYDDAATINLEQIFFYLIS
jgi:hypothetical protein